VAAELTNHLIDDVVLTPGIVATIPETAAGRPSTTSGEQITCAKQLSPQHLPAALLLPLAAQARGAGPSAAPSFPPWQTRGRTTTPAQTAGFRLRFPQVDDLADFHGDVSDPKLVLYVGGNYFFAMSPLVASSTAGSIGKTLPPGVPRKSQIEGWRDRYLRQT